MEFKIGEWVVHCTHGLGQILAIEKQEYYAQFIPYYKVQVSDLTIWIPVDENIDTRLRYPGSPASFQESLAILSGPAKSLPTDRRERNIHLQELTKKGEASSLCRVIRDLAAFRTSRFWNEYDATHMRRAEKSLLSEWSYVLAIPPLEAAAELHRLLAESKKQ